MATLTAVLGLGKLKLLMDSKVNLVLTFPRLMAGVVLDLVGETGLFDIRQFFGREGINASGLPLTSAPTMLMINDHVESSRRLTAGSRRNGAFDWL